MYRSRRISKFILAIGLFLFEISQIVQTNNEDDVLEWVEPASCTKNEYFDTDSLKCKKCLKNLISSDDGFECVCDKDSKLTIKDGNPVCDLCEPGQIRTTDGHECIFCRAENLGTCDCSGNEIKIERSLNGTVLNRLQCLPCPKNTYPSSEHRKCLPCIPDAITSSGGNRDDLNFVYSSHENLRKYCMPQNALKDWPDVRNTYLVRFKKKNVDSYFFRTELRFTVYSCENGVQKACRQLANMCALTLFTNGISCKFFMRKTDKNLPKIFYRGGEARTILNRRSIAQRYTLDQKDPSNKLKLIVAAFGLEGSLEAISEPSLSCPFFGSLPFGVNLLKRCMISAVELKNAKMRFFVPYLSYFEKSNDDKRLLHSLPVLIKNDFYTNDDDVTRWQLVSRFFSIDKITGYGAVPNLKNASFTRTPEIQVLRYLKSLSLIVKLQERSERGKIFPPLLVVEYGELTNREIIQNIEVSVEYKVTYSLPDDEMSSAVEVFIGVFTIFAVAFSIIKTWSYSRRSCENVPSFATISWFIIYCFGAVGNVLLVICSGTCLYTFIFYKGQKVAHILLPNDANEWTIRISIIVAFAFKTTEILGLIYQHRRMNIFFIDWEQPRIIDNSSSSIKYDSPHTSLRKSYRSAGIFNPDGGNTIVQSESEIIESRRNKAGPSKLTSQASSPSPQSISDKILLDRDPSPTVCSEANFTIDEHEYNINCSVSIWRTCVIANEWLKIKTKRKTNILLQILATLFILEIVGAKYWSTAVPELSLESNEQMLSVNESFTLKYAVGIIVYLIVYTTQWWFSVFIHERYIKNELQEFVDLCSMANISVFIMSHDFYGFYIHGRSVHGFADADLLTLINDLKREENNLCAHRGLIPGTIEQTFVISVSKTFRIFYDRLLGSQNSNDGKFLRRNISNVPDDWDKRWRTHLKIRKFLTTFLDHCYKNVDYMIKERHFLEKMCDFEMAEVVEKSIFYIDNAYSFDRAIFHGNEWTLATFEINVFLLVLVLGGNYILASVITILVGKIVQAVARFNGKQLLARKTFIDERFLVS